MTNPRLHLNQKSWKRKMTEKLWNEVSEKKSLLCKRMSDALLCQNASKCHYSSPGVSESKSLSVLVVLWRYQFLVSIFLFPRKSTAMSLATIFKLNQGKRRSYFSLKLSSQSLEKKIIKKKNHSFLLTKFERGDLSLWVCRLVRDNLKQQVYLVALIQHCLETTIRIYFEVVDIILSWDIKSSDWKPEKATACKIHLISPGFLLIL